MAWDTGAWRAKTAQELDAEKQILADRDLRLAGAAILEAAHALSHEAAIFDVIYNFIKNPSLYGTANAFKLALRDASAYPSAAELKQDALQRLAAKL